MSNLLSFILFYESFDHYRRMIPFVEEKGEQQFSTFIEGFCGVKVNVSEIDQKITINASSLDTICFLKVIILEVKTLLVLKY